MTDLRDRLAHRRTQTAAAHPRCAALVLSICLCSGTWLGPVQGAVDAGSATAEEVDLRGRGPTRIGACEATAKASSRLQFSLAHFNDLHARYSDRLLGHSRYAYLAGLLAQLKAQRPQTLILDAGDDYEKGAIADLRSQGEATRRVLAALPIDVRTIGNHDFAYGEAALLRDVQNSRHPVLAANLRHLQRSDTDQPFLPAVRLDVGCLRVGVIGLVTQGYGAEDRRTPDAYAQTFVHDDRYVDVLRRHAQRLRPAVDVLIALTHVGHSEDVRLAEQVDEVDIVVGAHTKDLLRKPLVFSHSGGRQTWVLRAGHDATSLGLGDVRFDPATKSVRIEGYKIVAINETLPVLPALTALVAEEERRVAPDTHVPLIRVSTPIPRRRMPALIFAAAQAQWQVDALIVGRDVFFAGLPAGRLTLQQLYDPVRVQRQPSGTPGLSSLWQLSLRGEELMRLHKQARSDTDYAVFLPSPPLDPQRSYRLAIEKRLLLHPDRLFKSRSSLPSAQLRGELIDVLEAYARARDAAGSPLSE